MGAGTAASNMRLAAPPPHVSRRPPRPRNTPQHRFHRPPLPSHRLHPASHQAPRLLPGGQAGPPRRTRLLEGGPPKGLGFLRTSGRLIRTAASGSSARRPAPPIGTPPSRKATSSSSVPNPADFQNPSSANTPPNPCASPCGSPAPGHSTSPPPPRSSSTRPGAKSADRSLPGHTPPVAPLSASFPLYRSGLFRPARLLRTSPEYPARPQ